MSHVRRWLYRLVMLSTAIYCLVVVYLALVWTFLPDRSWWITFTNLFAPLFFLPLLLLLPWLAVIRTRLFALVALTPLTVFALLFGGLFAPRLQAAATGSALRVVTANLLFTNQQIDAAVAALAATEADVIALQELSTTAAQAIEAQLADVYPYRWLAPADNPNGMGVLSRYPIVAQRYLLGERAQQVELAVHDTRLTLVNVHLHFDSINRDTVVFWGDTPILMDYDAGQTSAQVEQVLQDVAAIDGPLILLGDFNMGDREPAYRQLSSQLRDAFRDSGWGFGFTFPNNKRFGPVRLLMPVVRLDYVWTRGAVRAEAAEVDCSRIGADHCVVAATLRVTAD